MLLKIGAFNASRRLITLSKKSHNYGPINSDWMMWLNCLWTYRKFKKISKSFGACQPAQSAHADMLRYFSQVH